MFISGIEPHSDETVLADVRAALARTPELSNANIDATCERGVVTLRGAVASPELRETAERVAFEVRGVFDVVNQLGELH